MKAIIIGKRGIGPFVVLRVGDHWRKWSFDGVEYRRRDRDDVILKRKAGTVTWTVALDVHDTSALPPTRQPGITHIVSPSIAPATPAEASA